MSQANNSNNNNLRNELVGLIGIGTVGYGISLMSFPYAYIFVGLSFIVLSILASRNN